LVIIGGGFAGATLAKKLERNLPMNWEIYLLSKTNFITFNPLLPEVVGASILPGDFQTTESRFIGNKAIEEVKISLNTAAKASRCEDQ
jgi:NADH dehydrogenase FAD-containing subunit